MKERLVYGLRIDILQFVRKHECKKIQEKIGNLRVKNWSRAPENCTNILHKENKKMYLREQKTMGENLERETEREG